MGIDSEQMALAGRPIPAMKPVPLDDWLRVTQDYAAQLTEKAHLIETRRDTVLLRLPGSDPAEAELGKTLIEALSARADFVVTDQTVTRPDGQVVKLEGQPGLELAGALIQEDICLLEKRGDEHVLTAALLAFPASWLLAEKIGRPLSSIHVPVAAYDDGIAERVQRMFDALPPGRILTRANLLTYADPALHQPRTEAARRKDAPETRRFYRSERQSLRKLADTDAVVFTILTSVDRMADVGSDQARA